MLEASGQRPPNRFANSSFLNFGPFIFMCFHIDGTGDHGSVDGTGDHWRPRLEVQRARLEFQRARLEFQRARLEFQRPRLEFQRARLEFQRAAT